MIMYFINTLRGEIKMKMQIKKFASLFLCICMALSMLTVASFAAETTATLSFASEGQRTSYSTTKQVWEQNGVKLTNNKGSSSSNVNNSVNPVRLYAHSEVIIEYPNMNITKIEFTANSTTYATALKNSIGAEATVSSTKVTVVPTSASSTFTISDLTAQVRLNSLTVTGTEAVTDCEHTNTTTITTDATKTEDGSIVVKCNDCDKTIETTVIPALGCSVTYVVPKNETAPSGVTCTTVTLPEPAALTGDYAKEYEFAGWAEAEVALTDEVPALYKVDDKVTLKDDTTFYAVYKYSEKAEGEVPVSDSFVKKDIGDIVETDTVIITMAKSGSVYALTSVNGSSDAPPAETITVTNNEIASADEEFLWTVENTADGYVFHPKADAKEWLYTTTSNNGVRVGTGENKHFIVDAASGYLKNIEQGRYFGVYNLQDWRSYTTVHSNIAGQTLAFYVKSASDGTVTYYTSTLEAAGSEVKAIKGANIVVGSDLTVNFYVADEYANGTMTFAMNGKTTTVTADGTCFAFKGVAPDCMTDEITATLTAGGQTVGTLTTTVKELATEYLSSENDKIVTFVANMLHYGAESQKYQNDNGDLANEGVTGNTTADPIKVDGIGLTESATTYFRSANVWFSNQNSIIVNFQNLPENAKLLVNGNEVAFSGTSYTTEGLKATELDKLYTFTVCDAEGNTLQSLTYSVNYYAFAMKDNAKIGSLVKALYNYGVSAKELA